MNRGGIEHCLQSLNIGLLLSFLIILARQEEGNLISFFLKQNNLSIFFKG